MKLWKQITAVPGAASFAGAMEAALDELEARLQAIAAEGGTLRDGLARITGAGGKRLRPLLAWTSWRMGGGQGQIVPLMAMLELMHTASLIHDDLVDGAAARRGVRTINDSDGGLAALRSGDYLLARAMEFLKVYRGTGINETLSALSQEMCLGELEQRAGLFQAAGMTAERYFSRIQKKTALFLAECCRCGAVAGGAVFGDRLTVALQDYGLHLGMAFQMRDDLLDWEIDAKTGKTPLQDLRGGVITLPAVYAMEQLGGPLAAWLETRQQTPEALRRMADTVRAAGGLERTRQVLRRESGLARLALDALPDGPERLALSMLAEGIADAAGHGANNL